MQVLFLYPHDIQAKRELRKQHTVTHFDSNHLAHVIVFWKMQKFMCDYKIFALFYFEFESNFRVQAPRGLYLGLQFIGGFFLRY